MTSIAILRHSVLQIIRQPGPVLRIFLIPLSATFLLFKLTGLAFALSPFYLQVAISRGVVPWGRLTAVFLLSFLIGLWAAAAWHRFILMAERPRGFLPSVPWPVYWAFVRKSLWVGVLIFLLIVLASVVYGVVIGFASGITKRPPGLVAQAIGLCLSVPIMVLTLRLAVNLPAAAVQSPHGMTEIWKAMSDLFWTLLGLLLALTLLRYLAGEALSLLGLTPLTTPGLVVAAVLESLLAILSLSIVTTLYGRYIEGRALV